MIRDRAQYVTCNEAADMLEVTANYIRQLIYRKKLNATRIERFWLLKKKDITNFKKLRLANKEIVDNGNSN